jgi:hypothetical protein
MKTDMEMHMNININIYLHTYADKRHKVHELVQYIFVNI